jgi:hypothetical protein
MSYDLYLHFKPRIRRADMLAYFAARKHYKAAKDRVSYQNDDTGVYFWFDLKTGRDFLLRRTVVSAHFEINYNRPSFFGLEAEKELSALVGTFHPRIEDPQMHGMGEGPYASEGFLNGWNFGNALAARETVAKSRSTELPTLPRTQLNAAWEWNYDCAERRDRLNLHAYVPTILFWRIDGRASRVVVWGEAMPILLPRVDYVIVVAESSRTRQTGVASWDEVAALAKRAGFETGKAPIELRYLTPPPLIADWVARIPRIELKPHEKLHAYQILDAELVAAAREEIAREKASRAPPPPPSTKPVVFVATPDTPQGFGFKVMWFAIKTTDPAAVVDALEFGDATPANWASGMAAIYAERASKTAEPWVFVTPPLNGWVLAVSEDWPYPISPQSESAGEHAIGKKFDVLFARLMKRFDDVQFFGSHRVVDFVTWARALNGEPIRMFGYAGGGGTVLVNFGVQTQEEAQLRFSDLSGLSPTDADDRMHELAEQQDLEEYRLRTSGLSPREAHKKVRETARSPFPNETDVTDLAALWSIDPSRLEQQDHPPGVGLAVRLPKDLMQ